MKAVRLHTRIATVPGKLPAVSCENSVPADSKEEDIATLTATEDCDAVAVAQRYVSNVSRLYAMIDGADATGRNATDECVGVPTTAPLESTELARLDNLDEEAVSWEDVDADVAALPHVALRFPAGRRRSDAYRERQRTGQPSETRIVVLPVLRKVVPAAVFLAAVVAAGGLRLRQTPANKLTIKAGLSRVNPRKTAEYTGDVIAPTVLVGNSWATTASIERFRMTGGVVLLLAAEVADVAMKKAATKATKAPKQKSSKTVGAV
jgi:hypothetical protein